MCILIGVSGTPGVGKSYVAKRLAQALDGVYIELSSLVIEKSLFQEYDYSRNAYVADPEKINRFVEKLCSENRGRYIVIDSHYAEIIDPRYIHRLFVLRADPEEIAKRLCERRWPLEKILENVEAEIMGICLYNAVEEQDPFKICEIYEKNLDQAVEKILRILRGEEKCEILYIDWLSKIESESPIEIVKKVCGEEFRDS